MRHDRVDHQCASSPLLRNKSQLMVLMIQHITALGCYHWFCSHRQQITKILCLVVKEKNQTFQPDCDLKLCRAWKINRAIFANKYKKLASNAYFSIQEIAQCFGKHYLQTNCEEFKFKILLMSCVSFFVTPITNYSRFQRKLPISTPTLTTECIWLLYVYRSFQLERNVEVPFSFGRLPTKSTTIAVSQM